MGLVGGGWLVRNKEGNPFTMNMKKDEQCSSQSAMFGFIHVSAYK